MDGESQMRLLQTSIYAMFSWSSLGRIVANKPAYFLGAPLPSRVMEAIYTLVILGRYIGYDPFDLPPVDSLEEPTMEQLN